MNDKNHKRYQKIYKAEFSAATEFFAEHGGIVEWSPHAYEAFTYKADGVSLVFYPHRTTAGNYHIRVRNNGSKDRAKAELLMQSLHTAQEVPDCTFSRKLHWKYAPSV